MTQKKYILNLCGKNKDAIVVGSLGNISKDLKEIPHPNKVLIKGAMGCALGVGLGIAMGTTKRVIVLIGDGSFLMQMGSMSTILRYKLPNLRVIILNNNSYQSCGGQETNFKYIQTPFEVVEVS